MRYKVLFVFIAFAVAVSAQQQSTAPSSSSGAAKETIYYAGPDVVAPELIPPPAIQIDKIHHCKKLDGNPVIEMVVDAEGNLHNPGVTQGADGKLNEAALLLVKEDRFKPGTHDGAPAAISIDVEVDLKTCSLYAPEGNGVFILASLRNQPVQKVTVSPAPPPEVAAAPDLDSLQMRAGTTPPVPLNVVAAHYTDAARKAKISGACLIRVVVGVDGMPRDLQIAKSLDPGLDQEALKAVRQYRFKPAMRGGRPVPVMIMISVAFKIF